MEMRNMQMDSGSSINQSLSLDELPFAIDWELGRWTVGQLETLLTRLDAETVDPSDRLFRVGEIFQDAPFEFESRLPIPNAGRLRFRLKTFDCTTFVLTMLALARGKTIAEVAERLRRIRYCKVEAAAIDSDPTSGNIFDFMCECLIENAVREGLVANVTAEVAGALPLARAQVALRPVKRMKLHDPDERVAVPRFGHRDIAADFIPADAVNSLDIGRIRRGDIALMTKSVMLPHASTASYLVDHLSILVPNENDMLFMHSTRHFNWMPWNDLQSPQRFSGFFYDQERRREQIGVGYGAEYAGDDTKTDWNGDVLYGQHAERRRSLPYYMSGAKFTGMIVLRPL
jgi:hypothetical protein